MQPTQICNAVDMMHLDKSGYKYIPEEEYVAVHLLAFVINSYVHPDTPLHTSCVHPEMSWDTTTTLAITGLWI